ncbi:MAG: glycosyltransferase [Candidatus Promineifilaceae bacterium]|nr:glycosyltransferase [Candidatus Promineifilaceae bacterium]
MQITLVTVGSRGDVQPYVALGCGLQAAGYRVRLATHDSFQSFVRSWGLDFAPIAGNPQQIMQTDAGRSWTESGRNPLRFMRRLQELLGPAVLQMGADIRDACRGSDLLVYSTLGFVTFYVGREMGVPVVAAPLQPTQRTRAFPNISFPQHLPLGPWLNYLSHVVAEQLFWQPVRPVVNQWLVEALGVAPEGLLGPFHRLHHNGPPVIYGFSPTVVPPPRDWGGRTHVAGYWFLDQQARWTPPADLLAFLDAGPAPVYIGFGSMAGRRPEETTRIVRHALALSGLRAVVLRGWGALERADFGPDVFVVDSVPHDWLFPRVAAVVHHGGAGTTAAGLRAGAPSVLIPFFSDQNFWGERVHALGAGPAPLPRSRLTAAALAAALLEATGNATIEARAAAVGRHIRAEDGVARAVSLLEHYAA